MASVSAAVVAAVREKFPEDQVATVCALLAAYGERPHEREIERVQLDILKLASGRFDAIPELVRKARRDYRDILMWAEYSGR